MYKFKKIKKAAIMKKFAAVACAMSLVASLGVASAATPQTTDSGTTAVNGNVVINGVIQPLTIAITHQLTIDYTINPNDSTIKADPITITNDTKVPINVTAQSIASAPGGDLQFTDVGPNDKDWKNLSCTDTKKYIALGLKIADASGWNNGYYANTDWAASKTPVQFGTIASGATGNIALTAKTGLAFDSQYTTKASVVLLVNLA